MQEQGMLKKAAAVFVVCVGLATWISCGIMVNHFVYAATPASNQILAYREDPNSGVLTALAGSPFEASGQGIEAIAVHPSKKFLYGVNSLSNDISLFSISTVGVIAEDIPAGGRTSVSPATVPRFLAIDPTGSLMYIANVGSNNISVFSIDPTSGTATQLPGSPFPIGITPLNMALSPSGQTLYVTGGGSGNFGVIEIFDVTGVTGGTVTPIPGPQIAPGRSPVGLAIDPTGSFLYTANKIDNTVSGYTINSDGSLTSIPGFPVSGPLAGPQALLIDPSGKFLYVANAISNSPNVASNLSAFSISSSGSTQGGGALTLLGNSPFGTASQPSFIASDPNGKYLFVGNQAGAISIQSFSLTPSNGTLTSVALYPIGSTPTSIAVLQ
jgi:6-phosphogluconolactonase